MTTLIYLVVAYLCIGLFLATVAGGTFLINEHKQGKLRNLYVKEFALMLIVVLLMWPLLFVGVMGD